MTFKNYVRALVVFVLLLIQTILVPGNVSDYGEECNNTTECIDHRMVCSFNENNVSVCVCDRFHKWLDNVTGCVQMYNITYILNRVIIVKNASEQKKRREKTFFVQKIAGYFVLCVCGLTVITVMSYCCYVKKTDSALKKSLKKMSTSGAKSFPHKIDTKYV